MTATKQNTQIIKGKHTLTEEEKVLIGKELADALQNKEDLKQEASVEAQKYKDQISNEDKAIKECLDKIRTGEEDRDYRCRIERDHEQKQKHFVCIDSGRTIKTVPFQAPDYQHELGIETPNDLSQGNGPIDALVEKEEEEEDDNRVKVSELKAKEDRKGDDN